MQYNLMRNEMTKCLHTTILFVIDYTTIVTNCNLMQYNDIQCNVVC